MLNCPLSSHYSLTLILEFLSTSVMQHYLSQNAEYKWDQVRGDHMAEFQALHTIVIIKLIIIIHKLCKVPMHLDNRDLYA